MSQIFTIFSVLLVGIMNLWWVLKYSPSRVDASRGASVIIGFFIVATVLGLSEILSDFSKFPPPPVFMLLGMIVTIFVLVTSPAGGRLAMATPLRWLIGMQAFRILPETLLDLAYQDGLAPIQMTWRGQNFDIVSAILAGLLAMLWPKISRPNLVAWVYSFISLGLLFNILLIALLSMPTPLRFFSNEPPNTFVTLFPYIGLPMIHVTTALVLHGMTLRKLVFSQGA